MGISIAENCGFENRYLQLVVNGKYYSLGKGLIPSALYAWVWLTPRTPACTVLHKNTGEYFKHAQRGFERHPKLLPQN